MSTPPTRECILSIGDQPAPTPSRRPRILHVYKDYFPPVLGGVELTINLLAEGCLDEFDVSVLVNSASRHTFEETINGVRIVRVSEWGRAASAPISPAFITALARESHRADILHFHHPNPTGDLARLLSRPRLPSVMTYHSDVVRQQWAMTAYGPLQNWQMSQCAIIMPTSPNYMQSSPWLRRHAARCQVVPLGIRMDPFAETPAVLQRAKELRQQFGNQKIVLFVGRLRYYKGLQFLLDAAPSIPGIVLIAGTGPMESALREQVARLNIQDRVHFLGDISDEDKVAWYHAAHVFCMPSHLRSEAFGLSQVEAMACGTPVVSCNIASGVPFVNAHEVSGLVVPPEDPPALAQARTQLFTDDDLRQRLGRGAFERAHTEFTARRMCDRVKAVYRQVLPILKSPQ
jgi:rhamnosyl/mannosyltransferase